MQTEIMEIHTALQRREDEAGQALSGDRAAIRQIVIVSSIIWIFYEAILD